MSRCTSFLPPPHQGLLCVSSCSPMRSTNERMKHYKQASVTSPSHRVVLPVPPPPNTATLSCSHFPLHSSTLWWTTAIASSHPDQHCLRSLNLCTTRKSFSTQWFPLLNLQDWIVIVTTKNINFPNGKSWVTLPDAIEGSPKPGFGVQNSILEDTMLNTCTVMQLKDLPGHFQKQEFQYTSFKTNCPWKLPDDFSEDLNTQTHWGDIKQIWCPRHFRTAPILSILIASHWLNSHSSIPW